MSPIDDELRSALSSRTAEVELSPDFLTGVERRARGLHRKRVAASVAGSVLAVSALGVGGPLVASALVRDPAPPMATAGPVVEVAAPYALDPADPWAYRGDESVLQDGGLATFAREWGVRHGLAETEVRFVPLYGALDEPAAAATVAFLAEGPGVEPHWGFVQSGEAGPEFVVDAALAPGTVALPAAFSGDEVPRLLVVAAPEASRLEYTPDDASRWSTMQSVSSGVAVVALEGDPASDRFRVLGPDGSVLVDAAAPDAAAQPPVEDDGPGTRTPLEVDPAPYALDLHDPWGYRGPAELTQHPDLAVEDRRLFAERGTGRGDGSWSERPLLAVERPDGLSLLMVLRTSGDEAVVTTTWQRQDEAALQSEQQVRDGQLVVQSFLPQSDGTGLLVALAAPRTGAVETDVRGAEQVENERGLGVWTMPLQTSPGELFLYSEGDGLLYHSEPARRS